MYCFSPSGNGSTELHEHLDFQAKKKPVNPAFFMAFTQLTATSTGLT